MAELLIYAWTSSPRPSAFQKYDIISVRDDGFAWGKEECMDTFLVVRVDGYTANELKYLQESAYQDVYDADMGITTKEVQYARRYFFDYDAYFTQSELDAIRGSNWYVPSVALSAIGDKLG